MYRPLDSRTPALRAAPNPGLASSTYRTRSIVETMLAVDLVTGELSTTIISVAALDCSAALRRYERQVASGPGRSCVQTITDTSGALSSSITFVPSLVRETGSKTRNRRARLTF